MATEELSIEAERREKCGKSATRQIRREGKVPGVVYGHGQDAVPLAIARKAMRELLHHPGVVNLNFSNGGETKKAILKDVQHDTLTTEGILHVDFLEVRADEQITATVPIEPFGESAGVHAGGMMNQLFHELDVQCLPGNIPEMIQPDISELEIGDVLTVGELPLGEKVEPLADSEEVVVQIAAPRSAEELEEEETTEAEEDMEPEVIEKGKKEEEEEAEEGEGES